MRLLVSLPSTTLRQRSRDSGSGQIELVYLEKALSGRALTAERVKAGIEEEIVKLAQMPESRGLLRGTASKTVYRRVMKWSYRIIFTIKEEELRVLVVRIDHAKSDPEKLKELP